MKLTAISHFLKNNFWIILPSVFFILYKFWLISVAWNNRQLAPEPDDSYRYIMFAQLIIERGINIDVNPMAYTTFLPYSILLALISKFFGITAEQSFAVTFYLGTIILVLILVFFLKTIISDKKLIGFLIFFLSFYNGSGNYHGFYWVVPSFFAFVLFLAIFGLINSRIGRWHAYIGIFILSLPFVLMHPISVYASIIFSLWVLLLMLFERKFNRQLLMKAIFATSSSIFWSVVTNFYFISRGVPISGEHTIFGTTRAISEHFTFIWNHLSNVGSKLERIKNPTEPVSQVFSDLAPVSSVQIDNYLILKQEYFNLLFPHPIFWFLFGSLIIVLIKKKQFKILSLYFGTLVFVLLSSVSWFGYRSLGYLWPVTFILLGSGIYFSFNVFSFKRHNIFRWFFRGTLIGAIILLLITATSLNYIWSKNQNLRANLKLDKGCADYFLSKTSPNDKVNYDSKMSRSVFSALGMHNRERNRRLEESQPGEFFVSTNSYESFYNPDKYFLNFILARTSRKNTELNNVQNVSGVHIEKLSNHQLVKDCGDFKIYQIQENSEQS